MENKQSDKMQQKMKSTKEAIEKANDGQKKQSAQTHYQSAQQAQTANKQDECVKECDAAMSELNA